MFLIRNLSVCAKRYQTANSSGRTRREKKIARMRIHKQRPSYAKVRNRKMSVTTNAKWIIVIAARDVVDEAMSVTGWLRAFLIIVIQIWIVNFFHLSIKLMIPNWWVGNTCVLGLSFLMLIHLVGFCWFRDVFENIFCLISVENFSQKYFYIFAELNHFHYVTSFYKNCINLGCMKLAKKCSWNQFSI